MQNAKDTFYELLRNRLAVLNPERTVTIRGVLRPAVMVDANELASSAPIPDCFHLAWTSATVENNNAMPTVTLGCEITYTTAGSALNAGLDRDRLLAAMDGELLAAVEQVPKSATKNNYASLANGGAAMPMSTRIWWSEPTPGPVRVERDRLARTVSVAVMSYQEAGEL